ncbi:hypothetical protein CLU79DRAFT_765404, partial [Phycomyces nitens]
LAAQFGAKRCEEGETSFKYFFRVLKQRSAAKSTTTLVDPDISTTFTSPAGLPGHIRSFYQYLYSQEVIDLSAAHSLLDHIPPFTSLSPL